MSQKGRYCKKFFSEGGCPYGNDCKFLHSDMSNNRESVVINLGLGGYHGGGGGGHARGVMAGSSNNSSAHKTKLCHKFETMGFCPFGAKCRFAHGSHELLPYGGIVMPVPEVGRVVHTAPITNRAVGTPSGPFTQTPTVGYSPIVPQLGGYHVGVPLPPRMMTTVPPYPRLKPRHLRKDCNLVSRTYADWIDEME